MRCTVCNNEQGNRRFAAREMMFGTRDTFEYAECADCGCLWLLTPPADMARYYGELYYSLRRSRVQTWVRRNRTAYRAAYLFRTRHLPPGLPEWWPDKPPRFDARVLDVGSGVGNLLHHLSYLGFTTLVGVDPYVGTDMSFRAGPSILKRSIAEVAGQYDIVVLNHSFEHMGNPHEVIRRVATFLPSGGRAVIRTPIASTFAYRTYGSNWVQLDAPRHLFVHTPKSISLLADRAGLETISVDFDSTAFQFWGSEQYRRDIPLMDPRSARRSVRKSLFTPRQIKDFEASAQRLNQQSDGDQATFILKKRK